MPGWAANPDLIKALGNDVCRGAHLGGQRVSTRTAASFKALRRDVSPRRSGKSGVDQRLCADDLRHARSCLALAMEAAGPGRDGTRRSTRKIRDDRQSAWHASFDSFAEARQAARREAEDQLRRRLEQARLRPVTATCTPDFGVYVIEKGQLVRRDVVSICAGGPRTMRHQPMTLVDFANLARQRRLVRRLCDRAARARAHPRDGRRPLSQRGHRRHHDPRAPTRASACRRC